MPDLEAIKARLAAATPGPWRVSQPWGGYSEVIASQGVVFGLSSVDTVGNPDTNATLIAHAPTDLAALVAEVERLREQLAFVAVSVVPRPTPGFPLLAWRAIEEEHESNGEAAEAWRSRFIAPTT